jgi:N-acetylmuramoyl-L-alanine amidase
MGNVPPEKLRLLREAIEDNIETAAGLAARKRVKPPASKRYLRVPRARFAVPVLVAALTYLWVPSPSVSTDQAVPPRAASIPEATALAPRAAAAAAPAVPTVPAVAPQPLERAALSLAVRTVVIDPGHGGDKRGAVSRSGVTEKEIALDISLRLRRLMEQASFKVLMTRQADDAVGLVDRVAFANASRADIFVSVHVNSLPAREVRPLETFYVGPTEDAHTVRLAGIENRDSGYSLADYRHLLERVYMSARRDESRRLATSVNTELFRALSPINPSLENRGVKTAPFVVLIGTEMPAILVEVSCVSNEDEVKLLTEGEYREQIALGLLKGIRSYANTLEGSGKRGL